MGKSVGDRRAFAALVLASAFVGGNISAQTNVTWLPGTSGNWSTGASWTGGAAPNNGVPLGSTYNAFIDGGQAANVAVSILASQSFTVSGLNISSGDQLNINANGVLNLAGPATISNAGTIALGSVGTLNFNLGTVTLNGGGTITMNNSRLLGTGTLHNVDNRIIGNGSFGGNLTSFINNATISINGNTLIDPAAGGFTNTGLLEATAGILTLGGVAPGTFTNTGGTIVAQNGATISVTTSITGGTISTAGTGMVVIGAGAAGTFSSISNSGNITSFNGSNTGLNGAILNNGSINISPTSSLTDVQIDATTTLSGSGTASLNGSTVRVYGSGTLTNSSSHTIRGAGSLGLNQLVMVNNGLVVADITGATLTLDPVNLPGAFTNNGTLQAGNGGVLSISGAGGGDFINTGSIEALNGATVSIVSATIAGGTFSTAGTGVVTIPASNDGTFSNITNTGAMVSRNATNTYLLGSIVNSGSISILPTTSLTDVEIPGATTLSSTGTLVLGGATVRVLGGGTLTNASTHTIRGLAALGSNDVAITNNGMILADGGTLTLDPKPVASALINNGTLQALAGATLTLSGAGGGDFANNGFIDGAGTVSLINNASITGGTLNSTVVVPGSTDGAITNVVNLSSISSFNASNLTITGTILNSGSINVTPTTSLTDLEIPLATTFNGSGTINLSGATTRVQGGGTLTNSATHTIRGFASLGMNDLTIINNGRVIADGGTLLIDPSALGSGFTNNGTLQALAGATLTLSGAGGGAFANNGFVQSAAGATISLINAAAVTGGTLNGTVVLPGGHDASLSNVVNLGSITSFNSTNLTLIGTILNSGSINVTPTTSLTDLEIPLATTLNGSGTLSLDGASVRVQGGGTLTNSSTHTIRGIASLGTNDLAIINNGTITNNYGSGTLTIDPSPTGHFINNGSVRVTSGGTVDLSGSGGGTFGGSGSYNIGTVATLRSINSAVVSTGNIISIGTLIVGGTSFDAGVIQGIGIVSVTAGTMSAASITQGTLSIAAGRSVSIRPNGTVAGSSRVDTLTLTATSKLDINNNALIVDYTGATPFASIRSSLFTGYAGGAWTGNGIISTSAASDPRFAIAYIEASSTGFSGGFRGFNYLSDAVLLMYTYRGDVNLDRKVDSTDFSALVGAYGTTPNANWAQGDFDYNGKVNTLDFNWLAGNFGQSLPAAGDVPSLGAVVPEPGSIAAVGIAAATGLLRRNRRR